MDDLISRKAAIDQTMGKLDYTDVVFDTATENEIVYMLRSLPSAPAVPLDKLCEWLAEHSVIIPCETCRHFSNGYCLAIGDMDKPCPNKAEDWQRAIKEWMEGLDDHR